MGEQSATGQYLKAIKRRWWIPVLLAAVAVVGVYYRMGAVPPVYQASTVLLVTAPPLMPPEVPGAEAGAAAGAFRATRIDAVEADVRELLRTRVLAERVGRRAGRADIAEVQRSLTVTNPRDTNLIRIQARASTPAAAAGLANAAARELIGYFRQANSHDAREARRFIETQRGEVLERLQAVERRLLRLQGLATIEGAPGAIVGRYYEALGELDNTRRTIRELDARLAAASRRLGRESSTRVSETARLDNPVFRQIQSRLVELEMQRIELSQQYTDAHPRMQQLAAQIDEMRRRLATETETLVGRQVLAPNPIHERLVGDLVNLQVERAGAVARAQALEADVQRRRAAVQALPGIQARLGALMREHEILQNNYRLLSERLQEAVLRENVAAYFPTGLQVVDPAVAPRRPQPTSLPRTAAAGALAGVLLGLLAALTLETGDDKIRTRDDAERALGVPVLAEIPHAAPPRLSPAVWGLAVLLVVGLLGGGLGLSAYADARLGPGHPAGALARLPLVRPAADRVAQAAGWFDVQPVRTTVETGR
ncbi:MAG: hypothetical protein QN158_10405 [Armatimonadota bacterium]|nr:hypothetical protein [Armatimonadota bacterium]MDR7448486.1 hypothetical protein [Armatimonadota bacterium]MDR7459113.1 hypothetical protein [Armatimonadota bacterium]MDR7479429.1 hypothetical protein [Armatimonadota bacterium]MDR7501601.1 hypothetical protein [Armatimonadota bacterium]